MWNAREGTGLDAGSMLELLDLSFYFPVHDSNFSANADSWRYWRLVTQPVGFLSAVGNQD